PRHPGRRPAPRATGPPAGTWPRKAPPPPWLIKSRPCWRETTGLSPAPAAAVSGSRSTPTTVVTTCEPCRRRLSQLAAIGPNQMPPGTLRPAVSTLARCSSDRCAKSWPSGLVLTLERPLSQDKGHVSLSQDRAVNARPARQSLRYLHGLVACRRQCGVATGAAASGPFRGGPRRPARADPAPLAEHRARGTAALPRHTWSAARRLRTHRRAMPRLPHHLPRGVAFAGVSAPHAGCPSDHELRKPPW